jgi:HlyD family secretion protein
MASISGYISGTWRYVLAHKVLSVVIAIVVISGGWWIYGATHPAVTVTHYTLGTVNTGTVIAAVSGTGQVSATDQVNIQAQVTGNITWVGVSPGDVVQAGQPLMTIDDTTALQSIANAKASLAASQLTYQQSQAQAPISYQNDVSALATAQQDLQNDYNNTYNDLTTTYLDLPGVMSVANDTIYGYEFDTKKTQWNKDVLANLFSNQSIPTILAFEASATSDYTQANDSYDASLAVFQQTPRTATSTELESLLAQSVSTETTVAQTLQTELNFLNGISDAATTYAVHLPTQFATLQSTARTNLATANNDLSMLLADQKTIATAKQTVVSAGQTISLDQVGNDAQGSNPISLQVASNSIQVAQQNIANQEANLAYYTIRAPFAGTIAAVNMKVGDNVSGTVASIVSSSQVATLTLNEVDAAKIALGEKASMTFDAINGLTLTGTVAEIDPVGTVSQGVVSYNVQINFDTQDPRVRPGMTVNADIQTAVHQDVLVVPSSAVKAQGATNYVQVFTPPIASSTIQAAGTQGITSSTAPVNVTVSTGLSDNSNTEILSGLTQGEQIVTRTTTSASTPTAAAAATTRSTTGIGGGGGGAGAIRL